MENNLLLDFTRLILSDRSNENKIESYRRVLDSAIMVISVGPSKFPKELQTMQVNDAFILLQMVVSKGMAITELINGLKYTNSVTGSTIQKLLDPFSIAVLTRTQFEAFSTFHNIYNSHENPDVVDLLHEIWKVAGLNERQRISEPTNPSDKAKLLKEKGEIETSMNKIRSNSIYQGLPIENKQSVERWISQRRFELAYRKGKLVLLPHRDMFLNAGVNENFSHLYSLLSWYTHPSHVSVFQFSQMFNQNTNEESAYTMLNISRIIISLLITEYCQYLPPAMELLKKVPKINQLIIYTDNKTFRKDHNFTLDAYKEFESQVHDLFGSINQNVRNSPYES